MRRHANCLLARFVETFPEGRIPFRPVQVAPHSESAAEKQTTTKEISDLT